MKLEVRQVQDDGLVAARGFARADLLGRALLHASLEQPELLEHSRHWAVLRDGALVGLAAQIDGLFRYRSVPMAAALPGSARALLPALDRPFEMLAAESAWRELARGGGERTRVYLQMARLLRSPLPGPDPSVERLHDLEELAAFLDADIPRARLELGPFFGARAAGGELIAAGGVEFVTDALAQIALVQTAQTERRKGLARAIVIELVRLLEREPRRVILQVRGDNDAAVALYSDLGFRGTRRLGKLHFGAP